MDYEVVIPAASKDYNKLPYLFESLHYLNPQPKRVRVIHASETLYFLYVNTPWPILYHNEKDVLDFDPTEAKMFRRPQWIYQQFLKLFQNITTTDDYLILDSDLIINRPLNLLDENGKPKFFLGNDQNHAPYFRYSKDMFGFGREYDYSFISEIMLFKKSLSYELICEYHNEQMLKGTEAKKYVHWDRLVNLRLALEKDEYLKDPLYVDSVKHLYDTTCSGATDNWIPADYEIYGNFIEKSYPDMYTKTKIKTLMKGRYINQPWENKELEQYIEEMKGTDYDTFTAHTWI